MFKSFGFYLNTNNSKFLEFISDLENKKNTSICFVDCNGSFEFVIKNNIFTVHCNHEGYENTTSFIVNESIHDLFRKILEISKVFDQQETN